jgi:dipeptidyl aminopeptidase/acylaminoacyl peptidase
VGQTMRREIRDTDVYRRIEQLHRELHQAGTGLISEAAEISANGAEAAFAGTLVQELTGALPMRICLIGLAAGDMRALTFGPNVDRLPKFSPDGRQIAFLSDRQKQGDFQLYFIDRATGVGPPRA